MFEQTFHNIDKILRKQAARTTERDDTEQTSWILLLKYLDDFEPDRALHADLLGKRYAYIAGAPHRWSTWPAPKKPNFTFDHDTALTGDDLIK